ncbi:MAG TPA: hypothetical protein VH392_05705, partial [Sphingomicrobium sp.]
QDVGPDFGARLPDDDDEHACECGDRSTGCESISSGGSERSGTEFASAASARAMIINFVTAQCCAGKVKKA